MIDEFASQSMFNRIIVYFEQFGLKHTVPIGLGCLAIDSGWNAVTLAQTGKPLGVLAATGFGALGAFEIWGGFKIRERIDDLHNYVNQPPAEQLDNRGNL